MGSTSTEGSKQDEHHQWSPNHAPKVRRPSYNSFVHDLPKPDDEKHSIFSFITRSGCLLLVTKFLLSVLVEKAELESSTENQAAARGLLLKDVVRNFYINYGINLAIGIPLGMLADCFLGKKMIMVMVLCGNICFYFYMVVSGLRPVWADQTEDLHWKTEVFFETTLHSIRGIETAAMLESLKSNDYKLLYVFTFLKIMIENFGKASYLVLYLLCAPNTDSAVIINFVSLFLCIVVFFIWILFVSSLKKSSDDSTISCNVLRKMIAALIWKLRLSNRDEKVVPRNIGKIQKVNKSENTGTSKKLLHLCLLIIPAITTGFLYHASAIILKEPFSRLKSWESHTLNILDVSSTSLILVTLPLVEFTIVPFFRRILKRKIKFVSCLVLSMVTGVVAYLYGVLVVRLLIGRGSPLPDNWTSEVRFLNALNYSVIIRPVDKSFTSGTIAAKSDIVLTYVRTGSGNFPSRQVFDVHLESSFSYVATISLEGEKCVTYFVSDYMEMHRVPGTDPIFEGPPGTNLPYKARMYFANLDSELTVALVLTFQHSSFHSLQLDEPVSTEVEGGQKKVFQINAGTYILTIAHTDVSKSYTFGPGGVYGVIYSPVAKEETLNYMVAEILPPKTFSGYYGFVYECLACISVSFIVVIMEVFVYFKSPHNWRSSAFSSYHFFNTGLLSICHYLFNLAINESGRVALWTLIIYTTLYLVLCVITGFIVIKFRRFFGLERAE